MRDFFYCCCFCFQKPKTSRILPKVTIIPKPITDSDTIIHSPISPISLTQSELDLYT
jgi:hypothetical protein